jgi:hypothetical protein
VYLCVRKVLPMDEDFDEISDPGGLTVASGICVSRALKKLYSCQHNKR